MTWWMACKIYKIVIIYLTEGVRYIVIFVNLLAPGIFEWNFRHVIFKQILVIDGWDISCDIFLIWLSLDFADD